MGKTKGKTKQKKKLRGGGGNWRKEKGKKAIGLGEEEIKRGKEEQNETGGEYL